MTQNDKTEKEDREDRYQRRRNSVAQPSAPSDTSLRRRNPYKREHINYDDYLEDEWFEEDYQ